MERNTRIGRMAVLLMAAAAMALGEAQNVYYLPAFVDAPMASGRIKSSVQVVNRNATKVSITLEATKHDGTAAGLGLSGSYDIEPGATKTLESDGTGDGSPVSVKVAATQPVVVTQLVTLVDRFNTTVQETVSGDADPAMTHTATLDGSGVDVGLSLKNTTINDVIVTFLLKDATGLTVAEKAVTMAANGMLVRYAKDLFPELAPTFQGTLMSITVESLPGLTVRGNGGGGVSVEPSTPAETGQTYFLIPAVADGPAGGVVRRTVVQIANPGKVAVTGMAEFRMEDSTPMAVTIPGMGTAPVFAFQVEAGGTAVLQTDGSSAGVTGVVKVEAVAPIVVEARVQFLEEGVVKGETALPQSAAAVCWTTAVSVAPGMTAKLTLYNPSPREVAVTLKAAGADGVEVGTAEATLAAGQQTAVGLAETLGLTAGFQGTVSFCGKGGAGQPLVTALLRMEESSARYTAGPLTRQPFEVKPRLLGPKLDGAKAAGKTIGAAGGTIEATGADGTKFKLEVPANALDSDAAVTMTPVTEVSGRPEGSRFVSAVQFAPEGLLFRFPVTLEITPAKGFTSDERVIAYGWSGPESQAYPVQAQATAGSVRMTFQHFSGGGVDQGGGQSMSDWANGMGSESDSMNAAIDDYMNGIRDREARTGEGMTDEERAYVDFLLQNFYNQVLEPLARTAQSSKDRTLLRCAATQLLEYQRKRDSLGLDDALNGNTPAWQRARELLRTVVQLDIVRCQNKETGAGQQLIRHARDLSLVSSEDEGLVQSAIKAASECIAPAFEMTVKARMWGTMVGIDFDTTTSTKTLMDMKVHDLGSGNELTLLMPAATSSLKYDQVMFDAHNKDCTYNPSGNASEWTVRRMGGSGDPWSTITYDQNLKDPNAKKGSTGTDGKTTSFCTPEPAAPQIQKAFLWVDPGAPTETIGMTCKGIAFPFPPLNMWKNAWVLLHQADQGADTPPRWKSEGWTIMNGDDATQTLLTKTYEGDVSTKDGTAHEMTILELRPTKFK